MLRDGAINMRQSEMATFDLDKSISIEFHAEDVIERKMLVKRARKVCTCVTFAIFTKLTIFTVGNPIICLLRNFTGYLRYTQASISLSHLENCAPPLTTRGPEFRPP